VAFLSLVAIGSVGYRAPAISSRDAQDVAIDSDGLRSLPWRLGHPTGSVPAHAATDRLRSC
jgi:hypothetical protein